MQPVAAGVPDTGMAAGDLAAGAFPPRRALLAASQFLLRPPQIRRGLPAVARLSTFLNRAALTLFTADAVTLIHNASRGYPRAINNLGVNALTSAFARETSIVDEKVARIAISETGATDRHYHHTDQRGSKPTTAPSATSGRGLPPIPSSAS